MEVSNVRFLLIQGEIVDVSVRPDTLNYIFVDDVSGFQVAVGCVNEFGKPEIIGIIAEMHPCVNARVYRISSEIDGYNRLVGITDRMKTIIQNRLGVYWRSGKFADLCNLPQPVILRGEK